MKDRKGQATTEYMLLLLMVVTVFITLFKGVLLPAFQKAQVQLGKTIDSLYSGDSLHLLHFKINK